ncbi:MAG: hypothetical protein ACE5L7_03665 [Candidatus Aminicenantales bacterium]
MPKKFLSKIFPVILSIALIGLVFSCAPKKEPADLVLTNGKIVTVDEANPEAEALAVRGDTIEAAKRSSLISEKKPR